MYAHREEMLLMLLMLLVYVESRMISPGCPRLHKLRWMLREMKTKNISA